MTNKQSRLERLVGELVSTLGDASGYVDDAVDYADSAKSSVREAVELVETLENEVEEIREKEDQTEALVALVKAQKLALDGLVKATQEILDLLNIKEEEPEPVAEASVPEQI